MQVVDAAAGRFEVRIVAVTAATTTVAVIGDVDLATAGRLRRALLATLGAYRPTRIDLLLHDVGFLDASGVAALVAVCRAGRAAGCGLRLLGVRRHVRRVIELTGLASLCELGE